MKKMVPINALYYYEKQLEEDYEPTEEEMEQAEFESYTNLQIKAAIEDNL